MVVPDCMPETISEFVAKLKNKPCKDCGLEFPPECMDFDHREPENKLAAVSQLHNKQEIIAEVAKCDLVCSNCHRTRTKARASRNIQPLIDHFPESQEVTIDMAEDRATPELRLSVPLPTNSNTAINTPTSLTRVVRDSRAIGKLLETILSRSGLTVGSVARTFGVSDESVRQYVKGRRTNPSMKWFIKVCDLAGYELVLQQRKPY